MSARSDYNPRWRFALLGLLVAGSGGLFLHRLFEIQILSGAAYRARAESQFASTQTAERGSIFFRERDGDLVSAAINLKDGSGKRFYPGGNLAAHALGFIGWSEAEERTGLYGLERYYNYRLKANQTNQLSMLNLLANLFEREPDSFESEPALADLVLTIEPTVTRRLQSTLESLQARWQATAVGGVVLEPRTGAIVGWGAGPAYDPGASISDPAILSNPLVEHVYEFGSIFKPITLAAAIDAGVITPETTYQDEGRVTIDGKTISNHDGRARGRVTMQEVLNQSLNTGAVFAMRALGPESFRDYLFKFGIGQPTGIDLPDESSGLIKNLETGREIEHATASFGQGIALTPLQMARALAVLANQGERPNLHLGDAIIESGRERKLSTSPDRERVIKSETAQQVTEMLVRTVDEALAGGQAKLTHYRVAAKTGTAQMPALAAAGYDPQRYLHSFFDYFPADDPQFLIFIYLVEPQGAQYASETLTSATLDLTKFLINYYDIPPDR